MVKSKITHQFIKTQLELEGYKLLSEDYFGYNGRLEYICPKGHINISRWAYWRRGRRCCVCGGTKRHSLSYVKSELEKEGYKLLSNEYINNATKFKYKCPKGHVHCMSWGSWVNGVRCAVCAGNLRLNIDFIRRVFKKEGYTLLTKKYKNSDQKLSYICPNGHTHKISWRCWSCGNRCAYCNGRPIITIDDVRKEFEDYGYLLVSDRYINNCKRLNYICPEGHRHGMSISNWRNGYRCPTCSILSRSGEGHWNWKGGISCEPYCDAWADKEYKESIKERDGFKCQNPDCWGKSNTLVLHHIDYNKKNCSPSNLITLCNSCNSRANYNRDRHEEFYRSIMYERGSNKNNNSIDLVLQ